MHVTQRGNNRQDCYYQDNDRLVYLAILRDLARLRRCAIHAYCLMTNHVHLLLTPSDESSCSLLMRDLARRYASYFNRRYAKTGQLWEGRFRSCLVDSADYVLACYRYIELNPVRAKMVDEPAAHAWSSFAGNAGARVDPLLTPHAEYVALSAYSDSRVRQYAGLFNAIDDGDFLRTVREATEAGYPLVSERLRTELELRGMRVEPRRPGPRVESGSAGECSSEQLDLLTE